MIIIAALMSAVANHAQLSEPFEQKIPGTVVSFRMIPIPDGEITVNQTKHSIKNLCFGETEMSWDVFDVWMLGLDHTPEEHIRGIDAQSRPSKPYGAPDRGFGHAGYAALSMTYHSATVFCQWLSLKTGRKYRLPTEVEWEYAARAGETHPPAELGDYAWFRENAEFKTRPIGKKKPNAWGLFDMLGNAGEWATGLDGKPVLCGGTYRDKREGVHFGAKVLQQPSWNQTDPQIPKSKWWLSDGGFVGFRVVCER